VASEGLTEGAKRLIAQHVTSVVHLEVLLLLIRSGRGWRVQDAADELRASAASTREHLTALTRSGLAEQRDNGEFRLGPVSAQTREALDELESAWRERMHSVIDFIYARPPRPLTQFANAFLLKKEKDDA
jgi:predicted DNA-binding transcriptional regulator